MNHPARIQRDRRWHLAARHLRYHEIQKTVFVGASQDRTRVVVEVSLMRRHVPSEEGKT